MNIECSINSKANVPDLRVYFSFDSIPVYPYLVKRISDSHEMLLACRREDDSILLKTMKCVNDQ